jgi:hypothetical protein
LQLFKTHRRDCIPADKEKLARSIPECIANLGQSLVSMRHMPGATRNGSNLALHTRISGGKATVAHLFVNNAIGQRGPVYPIDEISGVS